MRRLSRRLGCDSLTPTALGVGVTFPASTADAGLVDRNPCNGSVLMAAGLVYDVTYVPLGVAVAWGGWQPTPVMVTDSALAGVLSDGSAQVRVRNTALSGQLRVDDIFVDRWNRG
jgi:hypothetical protein